MRIRRSVQVLAVILLAAAFSLQASAQNGTLTADAYTTPSSGNSNFSTTPSLIVSGAAGNNSLTNGPNNRVWLQFDISNLPPGTTASQISSATLTLYMNRVYTSGAFDVNLVSGSWAEGTLTENTSPALGANVASGVAAATSN